MKVIANNNFFWVEGKPETKAEKKLFEKVLLQKKQYWLNALHAMYSVGLISGRDYAEKKDEILKGIFDKKIME